MTREISIYQVDAFASKLFEGNPAAICPLDEWLPETLMQSIALENNLSETAFFVENKGEFSIRWFTPQAEVDLCGHATLASAFVIFTYLNYQKNEIIFHSKSGMLKVSRNNTQQTDWYEMNFPSQKPSACALPSELKNAFNQVPIACLRSEDYILIFSNEDYVKNVTPDIALLKKLDLRGVLISSQSQEFDFVARCFAPKYGIDEDPVTGSAYTQLVPYWSSVIDKKDFLAKQVSSRGGVVKCSQLEDRVLVAGTAIGYLSGRITI